MKDQWLRFDELDLALIMRPGGNRKVHRLAPDVA